MSLPVPASTDPVADAAAHIGALADAIGARFKGRPVAYWAGPVTTHGSGDFNLTDLAGTLASVAGVIITDRGTPPHLFVLMGGGAPATAWVRTYTYSGGAVGAVTVDVSILAFGTPA